MNVLVTGFGPFLDVVDNPSGTLARAVDGRFVHGARITGVELPVTWGCADIAAAHAAAIDAQLIIGLGVDRSTQTIDVETRAYNRGNGVDNEGATATVLDPAGPALVYATADARRLAAALGGRVDDDAGRYVCNAWLYGAARKMPHRSLVFVHIPPWGLGVEALVRGIGALLTPCEATPTPATFPPRSRRA